MSQDAPTRAFLLTNLLPAVHDHHHHPLKFKVPIDVLGNAIPEIGSFPYDPPEREWQGPTLFIKGSTSKYVFRKVLLWYPYSHICRASYINRNNIPIAKQFFPNMVLETLEAGHMGMN